MKRLITGRLIVNWSISATRLLRGISTLIFVYRLIRNWEKRQATRFNPAMSINEDQREGSDQMKIQISFAPRLYDRQPTTVKLKSARIFTYRSISIVTNEFCR